MCVSSIMEVKGEFQDHRCWHHSFSFIEENNTYKNEQKKIQKNQRMPPGMASQEMMMYWGMAYSSTFVNGRWEYQVINSRSCLFFPSHGILWPVQKSKHGQIRLSTTVRSIAQWSKPELVTHAWSWGVKSMPVSRDQNAKGEKAWISNWCDRSSMGL